MSIINFGADELSAIEVRRIDDDQVTFFENGDIYGTDTSARTISFGVGVYNCEDVEKASFSFDD